MQVVQMLQIIRVVAIANLLFKFVSSHLSKLDFLIQFADQFRRHVRRVALMMRIAFIQLNQFQEPVYENTRNLLLKRKGQCLHFELPHGGQEI